MAKHENQESPTEARDIVFLAGGAALIILGAGLVLTHPLLRRRAKEFATGLLPEFETPVKAGIRGMIPEFERYLKLKRM